LLLIHTIVMLLVAPFFADAVMFAFVNEPVVNCPSCLALFMPDYNLGVKTRLISPPMHPQGALKCFVERASRPQNLLWRLAENSLALRTGSSCPKQLLP
jgi:hypothetical protein